MSEKQKKEKKEKKSKKERRSSKAGEEDEQNGHGGEMNAAVLAPIAHPLAASSLSKKLLKLTTKAAKKKHVKRGMKEVVKAINKREKGIGVFAGDISPIDVITHLPVLCEENQIPYVYVGSKDELGTASQMKRATSCVLITVKDDDDYKDLYQECFSEVQALAQ